VTAKSRSYSVGRRTQIYKRFKYLFVFFSNLPASWVIVLEVYKHTDGIGSTRTRFAFDFNIFVFVFFCTGSMERSKDWLIMPWN